MWVGGAFWPSPVLLLILLPLSVLLPRGCCHRFEGVPHPKSPCNVGNLPMEGSLPSDFGPEYQRGLLTDEQRAAAARPRPPPASTPPPTPRSWTSLTRRAARVSCAPALCAREQGGAERCSDGWSAMAWPPLYARRALAHMRRSPRACPIRSTTHWTPCPTLTARRSCCSTIGRARPAPSPFASRSVIVSTLNAIGEPARTPYRRGKRG